ncbi:hypothetical protein PsYK624_167210 [Phanerochaete sordida]|uniref:Uncharacterized protein n=1 Tax=Phanerochaete sordida TaxID=48140 RepID=A0A9P3GS02_9APHY|nr:hypothetical protein PsYK624_167210 [Phanerochaete sordida]
MLFAQQKVDIARSYRPSLVLPSVATLSPNVNVDDVGAVRRRAHSGTRPSPSHQSTTLMRSSALPRAPLPSARAVAASRPDTRDRLHDIMTQGGRIEACTCRRGRRTQEKTTPAFHAALGALDVDALDIESSGALTSSAPLLATVSTPLRRSSATFDVSMGDAHINRHPMLEDVWAYALGRAIDAYVPSPWLRCVRRTLCASW